MGDTPLTDYGQLGQCSPETGSRLNPGWRLEWQSSVGCGLLHFLSMADDYCQGLRNSMRSAAHRKFQLPPSDARVAGSATGRRRDSGVPPGTEITAHALLHFLRKYLQNVSRLRRGWALRHCPWPCRSPYAAATYFLIYSIMDFVSRFRSITRRRLPRRAIASCCLPSA